MIAYQINPRPLLPFVKPVRDPNYMRYVKQFPCVGCGRTWGVDPCHCGPHGVSQKACDLTCIPLCRVCHRLFDANPVEFASTRSLDVPALQRMFQRFYCLKHGNPAHWPNHPDLTLSACSTCRHEDFTEEFRVRGECPKCGAEIQERAA